MSDERHRRIIGTVAMNLTTWRVDSDCGVVKLHSSRDGCMAALNPARARLLGAELHRLLDDAAESVENAAAGAER